MRTKDEVKHAFSPVGKLAPGPVQRILRTELAFQDLATEIMELVPESADRTAALRKLLESKMTCVQAISHEKQATPQVSPKKEIKKNVDSEEEQI